MATHVIVADSITKVSVQGEGAVIVNASHGGIYAAYLASEIGALGAIFNDAGVGLQQAGIAGLAYLNDLGAPAATVGHESARIGDGKDMMTNGIITFANDLAQALGVAAGQHCQDAAALLARHEGQRRKPAVTKEGSFLIERKEPILWALDSASLVSPEHGGAVVCTGSHGGLIGGDPRTALKCDVLGVLYNDAGIGKDRAGVSRLPILDQRGIPAATVSASSARIGDARSTYDDGVISCVNEQAKKLRLEQGMTAREFVSRLRKHLENGTTK